MTKAEAIYQFFGGYGLPAYEESSVPVYSDANQTTEIHPPYITYQMADADFWGGSIAVTADIWDHSDSWTLAEETAAAIAADILPFKKLRCDDGYILITKGSPFSQNVADDIYKRKALNLWLTFVTN